MLAAAWARDAATEHASIASFARFIHELLAFGAPAELVRAATRAMTDEIAHAEACFALATRFRGAPVGPGKLRTHDAPPAGDLETAVRRAISEGCVGETLSALVAEAALLGATDPDVRRVLGKIVRDEARHSELAWRFVAWAVEQGGEPVALAAQDQLQRALASEIFMTDPIFSDADEALFRACGRISGADQRQLARRAMHEIIAPCATALFRSSRGSSMATSAERITFEAPDRRFASPD
jgi:hypothetical protein